MTETELRNLAEAATPLDHLLVSRGLYWRPDKKGYTGLKCEAGRYPKGEAEKYHSYGVKDSDVHEIHENDASEYAPNCAADIRERHMLAELTALRAKVKAQAEAWDALLNASTDNNGVEQDAFEEWAKANSYDMRQHSLHWLFLDSKTYAARQGWKSAMGHVKAQIEALRRAAQEAGHE